VECGEYNDEVYRPPPRSALQDILEVPVPIGDAGLHRYFVRVSFYHNMVVDFSVQQEYRKGPSPDGWVPIHRIDSSHGEIHRHYFTSSRGEVRRVTIERIPPKKSWEMVDRSYGEAIDDITEYSDERFRRWRDE